MTRNAVKAVQPEKDFSVPLCLWLKMEKLNKEKGK